MSPGRRSVLHAGALTSALAAAVGAVAPGVPAKEATEAAATTTQAAGGQGEGRLTLDWLDNGGFFEAGPEAGDGATRPGEGSAPASYVPWWHTVRGAPQVEPPGWEGSGSPVLTLPAGAAVRQPLAVPEASADSFLIRGEVFGPGRVQLFHGENELLMDAPVGVEGEWSAFQLAGALHDPARVPEEEAEGAAASFVAAERARPRLMLVLGAPESDCAWRGLESALDFADPGAAGLRAEVLYRLDALFAPYFERALDDVGPTSTAFVAFDFDADTGERGPVLRRSGLHPLYVQLFEAWRVVAHSDAERSQRWLALLERFLTDLFELGFHPDTGLPRSWDAETDEPVDQVHVEIGLVFGFLIDLAEHGPAAWRERASSAAQRLAEAALRYGRLPDGQLAAAYRPADGDVGTTVVPLRRLDVAAPLARMGALLGDERMTRAAREAVLTLEFDHHWPSTASKIDPGFDDDFGHYGARAVTMWKAHPTDLVFRRLAVSGYDVYVPALWQVLESGGYIAADQTRCWGVFCEMAALEPERAADLRPLLMAAARTHFKGQQGTHGAWLDVTMQNYDPITNLPVGDVGGVPQNLFFGLARLMDPELGLGPLERSRLRVMFAALLRSTLSTYGGDYGLIAGARRLEGAGAFNSAGGSLRLAGGLIEWLRQAN